MRKYVVEFIGTFFLLLSIFLTGNAAAITATLIGMIYASGHISKAHFNPAVTLAFWWRGGFPIKDVGPYIIAQLLAVTAAIGVAYVFGNIPVSETVVFSTGPALLGEFIGTFALVYVILHVATASGTAGNTFYGLAIGAIVYGGIAMFGDISGAAFNPAVAIGLCLAKGFAWSSLWVYLVGQVVAALVATFVYRYVDEV